MKSEITLSADETALVERAHQRLLGMLAQHGNIVSGAHSTALADLLWLMTAKAVGKMPGWHVAPLPTGSGKTTAITAWIAELMLSWEERTPVCVSMFTVEALCRQYRALVAQGVDPDEIGLIHSYEKYDGQLGPGELPPPGKASEDALQLDPETGLYPARQILLVSHNKLRKDNLRDKLSPEVGYPELTIFDESLVTHRVVRIPPNRLRSFADGLANDPNAHQFRPLIDYLSPFANWYRTVEGTVDVQTYTFGSLTSGQRKELLKLAGVYSRTLDRKQVTPDYVRQAVNGSGETFRLFMSGQSELVLPEPHFPGDLDNLLILDASYYAKVTEHEHIDIASAERALAMVLNHPVDLFRFKRYDHVTVRRLSVPSGREAIENDLSGARAKWSEVLAVLRSISPGEGVLLFAFKDLGKPQHRAAEFVLAKLRQEGFDLDQTIWVDGVEKRRINILTWGQETSLNDFAHCTHVILYGTLRQHPADLAGRYFGAVDDVSVDYGSGHAGDHGAAEEALAVFQALSRGSCRTMVDGQAKPMTGYVMSDTKALDWFLNGLMPGVHIERWEKIVPHSLDEGEQMVEAIRHYVEQSFAHQRQQGRPERISSRKIRTAIDPGRQIADSTWTNYVKRATAGRFWAMDKSSIVTFEPPILLD